MDDDNAEINNGVLEAYFGNKESIEIPSNITAIDGILYDKEVKTFIMVSKKIEGAITILSSVTSIGDRAFKDCKSLSSVTIPSTVKCI